jgi:hypothetical protein
MIDAVGIADEGVGETAEVEETAVASAVSSTYGTSQALAQQPTPGMPLRVGCKPVRSSRSHKRCACQRGLRLRNAESRAGKNVVRQVTAKNRYARALAAVTAWCWVNRHQSIPDQQAHLTAMMRGHYAYYGITGNSRRIR